MSIIGKAKKYGRAISFHTPGHQGTLNKCDITELPDMFPLSEVVRAQKDAAKHFGCKHMRFLTNGSSIGVKAMIMSIGGSFIAPENRHRAVDEGAALAGVTPVYVKNEDLNGIALPLTVQQLESAFAEHPEVKAVLVTSPDYYGFTAQLDEIRAFCDKNKLLMLVDAAHGAHFCSDKKLFPQSASCIADACNMSGHKTMQAYTQSAYLAVNNESMLAEIDKNLQLLGTTSPSYILLGQLEKAVEFERKKAAYYLKLHDKIRESLSTVPFERVKTADPMRIVLDAACAGKSGQQVYKALAAQRIYAEMYDDRYVVFIVTLSTKLKNIEKLGKALKNL